MAKPVPMIALVLCVTCCVIWRSDHVAFGQTPVSATSAASTETPVRNVDELLKRLAKVQALTARFHEEKKLALMRRPLIAEGHVYFTRPGWIARWTDTPEVSVVLLKDGMLSVRDPGGKRELDVTSNPVLRAFVEGFVHVLSGNKALLERDYALHFSTQADTQTWELKLSPRSEALRRMVSELSFSGRGASVQQMRLLEASGDQTQMDFSDVQLHPAFDAATQARLFHLPVN